MAPKNNVKYRDVYGHLQLALAVMELWQQEKKEQLEALFLFGDVGAFTKNSMPDKATIRHAEQNPIELAFLTQWSTESPAPWLEKIFKPIEEATERNQYFNFSLFL